jgi:two-component system, sensor histidine kinase and response regulator
MESLKVLVVDDEPGMRKGVERALQGYQIALPEVHTEIQLEVSNAQTGEEALDRIQKDQPDILLLDHKLPGISGLDVLERIKTGQDGVLTVMITAYASLETAVTAIKRGAYDFLAKPFTPAELKATIRKVTESLVMARQARKLAQEKRQVRFQFISVLAHELKAPLASIEGYLEIMKDRGAGPNLDDYHEIIDRCVIRTEGMRKMILDLLDLTRIESGQKKRELTPVDVAAIARSAIETMAPQAQPRRIQIALHSDGPASMTADRSEIEIILNNLLSNAVKYNRDGGSVDITVRDQGDQVAISVADTGIGMTEQEAGRLFEDFVRIKNEKTRRILGSGLGLSIVKKLVYFYNGQTQVTSRPDQGSTFAVILKKLPENNLRSTEKEGVPGL